LGRSNDCRNRCQLDFIIKKHIKKEKAMIYLPPPPPPIMAQLVLNMPETPDSFNEKIQEFVGDEVKKYVGGLAGILAIKMLILR
jgi:hypothetical protein